MTLDPKLIHTKIKSGKTWLKIFYHNSEKGEWFTDKNEILFINTPNRFSLFGFINHYYFKIDDYYEFLLEYPIHPNEFNNWKQKIHPLESDQTYSNDVGYYLDETCHISWTHNNFNGISKSASSTETFLDGDFKVNKWYYSIGAKKQYNAFTNKFPGPVLSTGESIVSEVYLWIRVNPETINKLRHHYSCLFQRQSLIRIFSSFVFIFFS